MWVILVALILFLFEYFILKIFLLFILFQLKFNSFWNDPACRCTSVNVSYKIDHCLIWDLYLSSFHSGYCTFNTNTNHYCASNQILQHFYLCRFLNPFERADFLKRLCDWVCPDVLFIWRKDVRCVFVDVCGSELVLRWSEVMFGHA